VCGGIRQVSDSFGSALWAADVLFAYLKAGAIGANFHTWSGAWYSPISFGFRNGRRIARVRPLFYGMLLFAKATTNRAQLVRAHWRGHTRVHVWATKDVRGTVRVVLLNLNRRITRKVRLRVPGVGGRASVERLTARTMFARSGIRLAGRTYGRRTLTGLMRGKRSQPRLSRQQGVRLLELPAASAALVTIEGISPPRRAAP
jgi:hypothetical protein